MRYARIVDWTRARNSSVLIYPVNVKNNRIPIRTARHDFARLSGRRETSLGSKIFDEGRGEKKKKLKTKQSHDLTTFLSNEKKKKFLLHKKTLLLLLLRFVWRGGFMKGYRLFMFLFCNVPCFIFTVDRAQCIKITEQVRGSADKLSKNVQRNNCTS